jgi:hypothetical protein
MLIHSFEGAIINHDPTLIIIIIICHLADAFIQSDLQSCVHIDLSDCVLPLLYHRAHDLNLSSEVKVPLKSESLDGKLSRVAERILRLWIELRPRSLVKKLECLSFLS